MTDKPDNPYLFPQTEEQYVNYAGATLWDFYAAHALAGIAYGIAPDECVDLSEGILGGRFYAGAAATLADALLKEREKRFG